MWQRPWSKAHLCIVQLRHLSQRLILKRLCALHAEMVQRNWSVVRVCNLVKVSWCTNHLVPGLGRVPSTISDELLYNSCRIFVCPRSQRPVAFAVIGQVSVLQRSGNVSGTFNSRHVQRESVVERSGKKGENRKVRTQSMWPKRSKLVGCKTLHLSDISCGYACSPGKVRKWHFCCKIDKETDTPDSTEGKHITANFPFTQTLARKRICHSTCTRQGIFQHGGCKTHKSYNNCMGKVHQVLTPHCITSNSSTYASMLNCW